MAKLLDVQSDLARIKIRKYKKFNPEVFSRLVKSARQLNNKTVVHINATRHGGGVAELLRSEVLFEQALGLRSHWLVIKAPARFFAITKKIHNLIQGKPGLLTAEEKRFYLKINHSLGRSLKNYLSGLKPGIIVIHDPQPAPLIEAVPSGWHAVLRLHIDLSSPQLTILNFLKNYIQLYKKVVVSHKDYYLALPWLKKTQLAVIMPAIDPLSEKNLQMNPKVASSIMERFEIDYTKPIMSQVSRFDPWKDPLGVIQAYYLAKNEIPELQLVLAGFFMAQDDPEAIMVFEKVKKHARGDPDIFLFSNLKHLEDLPNNKFISALYTASTVVIQKSLKEGFGLTITEAMWKGKAVVAGMTKGALLQIKNGKTGFLVSSPSEAASAVVRLIKNRTLRSKLGRSARNSVKENFLITRFILENLKIYAQEQ